MQLRAINPLQKLDSSLSSHSEINLFSTMDEEEKGEEEYLVKEAEKRIITSSFSGNAVLVTHIDLCGHKMIISRLQKLQITSVMHKEVNFQSQRRDFLLRGAI